MEGLRVIDNTLPQSAWDHFVHPRSPYADRVASECFREFVNVVINSRSLLVPVPQEIHGGKYDDHFIRLAQKLSRVLEGGASGMEQNLTDEVVETYLRSLQVNAQVWSGWIRFQCTPNIVKQFTRRVPDWSIQLKTAWDRINTSLGGQPLDSPDQRLRAVLGALAQDIFAPSVRPRRYCKQAADLNVDLREYMLAYGLNWFAGGRAYAPKVENGHCGFHQLRDAAAECATDSVSEETKRSTEIDWAEVLAAYLEKDRSLHNAKRFTDLIEKIRDVVQGDEKYARLLDQAREAEGEAASARSREVLESAAALEDEAVSHVLSLVKLPLAFRPTDESWRLRIRQTAIEALQALEGSKLLSLTFLIPWTAKLLRVGMNSDVNRLVDVRLRRRLGMPLWHIYVIPGRHDNTRTVDSLNPTRAS